MSAAAATGSGGRCVIVGGGLLGLSAAWALSERGWSVTVLEAGASVGHPRSGSKGDARIFRLGYREPHYVAMAVAARALWRSLEASSGRTLLSVTGQLSFGAAEQVEEVRCALALHGAAGESLTAVEAAARAPGLVTHGPVLLEPDSGVLAADACLAALVEVGDFALELEVAAASVQEDSDGVSVLTADGRSFRGDVVVICAGPASLGLLSGTALDVGSSAVASGPSLPQVAYFRSVYPGLRRLPVFIEWGDDMIYGLPVLGEGPHQGTFKVSHHTPGTALAHYDPAETWLMDDDATLMDALIAGVRRMLPGLDPTPVATERCVYDNSSDTDFVLDRVGRVVVGCGTSGHGFKFGPLLGQVLADLAEEAAPPIDLAAFRLSRDVAGVGEQRTVG